jgi:hypothetical protein
MKDFEWNFFSFVQLLKCTSIVGEHFQVICIQREYHWPILILGWCGTHTPSMLCHGWVECGHRSEWSQLAWVLPGYQTLYLFMFFTLCKGIKRHWNIWVVWLYFTCESNKDYHSYEGPSETTRPWAQRFNLSMYCNCAIFINDFTIFCSTMFCFVMKVM